MKTWEDYISLILVTGEVKIHFINTCFLRIAGCQKGPVELINFELAF